MDFIIDTAGDEELIDKEELIGQDGEGDFETANQKMINKLINQIKATSLRIGASQTRQAEKNKKLNDYKTEEIVEKFFEDMGWKNDSQFGKEEGHGRARRKKLSKTALDRFININLQTGKFNMKAAHLALDETLKKSVLTAGFEKEHSLPEYDVSDKRKKALRKAERDKTVGPLWYNIPAPEITEELKTDLELLKMRSVMDPKHFYKKNDMEALPKYFQIGTVMDSALDHQNEKLTRKERKRTIVDELLADAEFQRFNKRKYSEIIDEKRKSTHKTYIKDKRMKNKLVYKQMKLEGKIHKKKRKNE